jgi:hypothetical protein
MAKQMSRGQSPGQIQTRVKALLDGVQQKLSSSTKPLEVHGVDNTNVDLMNALNTILARYAAPDAAHQAWQVSVHARDAAKTQDLDEIDAIESSLKNRYGATSPELAAFGIKPRKAAPRKLTVQERAAATEKARETRAEHGHPVTAAPEPNQPTQPPK